MTDIPNDDEGPGKIATWEGAMALIPELRKIAAVPPGEQSLWTSTLAAWCADLIEAHPQAILSAQAEQREKDARIAEGFKDGTDYDLEPEAAVAESVTATSIAAAIRRGEA